MTQGRIPCTTLVLTITLAAQIAHGAPRPGIWQPPEPTTPPAPATPPGADLRSTSPDDSPAARDPGNSYRAQTFLLDVATMSVLIAGLSRGPSRDYNARMFAMDAGMALWVFAAPALHMYHGRQGSVFTSGLLRTSLPALGYLAMRETFQSESCDPSMGFDCLWSGMARLTGAVALVSGMLAISAIDWLWLSGDTTGPERPPSTGPTITPIVGISDRSMAVGLHASF